VCKFSIPDQLTQKGYGQRVHVTIPLVKNKTITMKNSDAHSCILKSSVFKKYFLKFFLPSMILLIISCSSDDPAPASPSVIELPAQCKVQRQTIAGTGRESATITYTYDFLFIYTYDESGNQVGSNSTYKYIYSDGKTATSSSAVSNQFDENGFIIRRVHHYSSTNKDGIASNSSTNTEYTYAQERLIKESHTINENGKIREYSFSYEYDTEGKLIKVNNTYDNSFTKYEWNGNKIQKMTRVDQYGNSNSPFLEYNNGGLLIKSIDTRGGLSDEFRYQYDEEDQEIRFERYINAKPSSASAYEYDDKNNPNQQLYAKFKGHPTVPGTQSIYGPKHNMTKSTYYTANPMTGNWEVSSSTLYTHDYNGKDLPTETITTSLDKNGIQTNSSRTSYLYQDCQ
jgi:hypothetical protein